MEKLNERPVNNAKVLRSTMAKVEEQEKCCADQPKHVVGVCAVRGSTWLNNNNNSLETKDTEKQKQYADYVKEQLFSCESCAGISLNYKHITCAGNVEDEGGGVAVETKQSDEKLNGSGLPLSTIPHPESTVASNEPLDYATAETGDCDACAAGAASLTPPGNSYSNRTSVNNSTENLSYSSDNYYADDIILLEDDDVEAEQISLNSDDCVYAYRGDGAEFDIALDAIARRTANVSAPDDETDFLEMDFEPDPLSEVEYGSMDACSHADPFLLQRDSCHLSGRHSANMNLHVAHGQRQLFSSPIDDFPPPKALQTQSLLSKNFARISMHLDQIKGENGDDFEHFTTIRNEQLPRLTVDDQTDGPNSVAQSLPNTLHGKFGRHVRKAPVEMKATPLKTTGAKPKSFSTFSASSSTSSKNSSKSRTSLRSAFAPLASANTSFDERSVSCTEFRSALPEDCAQAQAPPLSMCEDLNTNDEACLDCLEKEFLANTIGKAMDTSECVKCRKRSSSMSLYARAEQARCRSGSPSMFNDVQDDYMFEMKNEYFNAPRNIESAILRNEKLVMYTGIKESMRLGMKMSLNNGDLLNQRRGATCDSYNGEQQMLKNLMPTEPEITTISTLNLNEETLVQALDTLHTSYNAELIKSHFKQNSNSSAHAHKFKGLHDLVLHESKKNCNNPKLKRLIELATINQVKVQFKKDTNIKETEMISISVADIMQQWNRSRDLSTLKQLDNRFIESNVLGKIANIIRQAQQDCSTATRRPLPESISILQYYPSGYFILTKKC